MLDATQTKKDSATAGGEKLPNSTGHRNQEGKMSMWYEVDDIFDLGISDDGKMLQVRFDTDCNGNNYVEVPMEILKEKLGAEGAKNE